MKKKILQTPAAPNPQTTLDSSEKQKRIQPTTTQIQNEIAQPGRKKEVNTMKNLNVRELMNSYEGLSLRRFAQVLNLNYNMVLKASKKPIPGTLYDPTVINFEAIEAYVADRVDEKVLKKIDWANEVTAPTYKNIDVTKDFPVGTKLTLRNVADEEYEVILMTTTHIVLNPKNSTQPRVLNLHTFLHQGPAPVAPETTNK